jgi:hypothetical protein
MAGDDSAQAGTCYELAGTNFTIRKKKSNEYSGVQKIRNWNNPGIPWNSEQFSQPSFLLDLKKAKEAAENANGKMESAAKDMFQIYANLLSV